MAPVALVALAVLPALPCGLQLRPLEPKLIHYVGYLFPDWMPVKGETEPVPGCPERCLLVRAPYDDPIREKADAVLFNQAGDEEVRGYPQERLPPRSFPAQRYLYSSNFEGPRDTAKDLLLPNETIAWNQDIDWTMTYRISSDFWLPWFRTERREHVPTSLYPKGMLHPPAADHDHAAGRDRLLLFMVSDECGNPRMEVFRRIAKHLPRDRVVMKGSCADPAYATVEAPCGGDTSYQTHDSRCMENYFKRFKFIFAAERDRAENWLTEKILRGLLQGMVPVFYGGSPGEDLSPMVPPNSIVNVDDFPSPASVAEHLLALDADKERYNAMHAWRQEYVPVESKTHALGLCQLCDQLFEAPAKQLPRRRFGNLTRWWTEDVLSDPNWTWLES